MPKQQFDIRTFVKQASRADAKFVKIKRNPEGVKFKLRLSKYLYTLVVNDVAKANTITKALKPGLKVIELDKKKTAKK